MPTKTSFLNHPNTDKIVFSLSIFVCAFWVIGNSINVYNNAVVGAIFEIVWLPVMLLSFVLPIVCTIRLFKTKFSYQHLPFYSLLILVFGILFLLTR